MISHTHLKQLNNTRMSHTNKILPRSFKKSSFQSVTLKEPSKKARSLISMKKENPSVSPVEKNMHEGKVFARSIFLPTLIKDSSKHNETKGEVEVRKTLRTPCVPTLSNKLGIKGNPSISTSMIGWGASVFASQGFLIVNPKLENIKWVSPVDCDSGPAKKLLPYREPDPKLHNDAIKDEKLNELLAIQKMGGKSRVCIKGVVARHNEVIQAVDKYEGVYFTHESNFCDDYFDFHPYRYHFYGPILQAIYLQQAYYNRSKLQLPIYEYSAKNTLREYKFDEDSLVSMWTKMCSDFVLSPPKHYKENKFDYMSLAMLKNFSMFRDMKYAPVTSIITADDNYPLDLQKKINHELEHARIKLTSN